MKKVRHWIGVENLITSVYTIGRQSSRLQGQLLGLIRGGKGDKNRELMVAIMEKMISSVQSSSVHIT